MVDAAADGLATSIAVMQLTKGARVSTGLPGDPVSDDKAAGEPSALKLADVDLDVL